MELKEFAEGVLKGVEEKAGGKLKMRLVPREKNNGIIFTGITASRPESSNGTCIYLNGYYEGYCNSRITLAKVTEDVYDKLIGHCNDLDGVDMRVLWDWEAAKECIHAKLVNREMNRGFLKRVPYRNFLDLAVIYYVTVDGLSEGVNGAFTVSERNMEVWKKKEDELYRTAVFNMHLHGEPVFESMDEVLRSIMPGFQLPSPVSTPVEMHVLTNKEKIFGAAEILDSGTLKRVSDELGGDFIVLPSSVHECIIIPADETVSYQELADMVTEINVDAVSIEERLSDHVYLYERKVGTLRIAA